MRWVLVLLAAAVLAGGGYFFWSSVLGSDDSADDLIIAVAQRGDLEDSVTATGTLQPKDCVDVGTQVSGQLKKVHVEIGAAVTAGQLSPKSIPRSISPRSMPTMRCSSISTHSWLTARRSVTWRGCS